MATDLSFMEYLTGQLRGIPEVSYKKMFGEYMLYVSGRGVALVCDNTLLVKKWPGLERYGFSECYPYEGSKTLHYAVDPDDSHVLEQVIAVAYENTPPKKVKR